MARIKLFIFLLPLAGLMIATGARAEEEYKTPANLTDKDRAMMLNGKADYKHCMSENVRKYQSKVGDPRALAELAMSQCIETLAAFDQELKDRNFHPDYREHYVTRVRNEGARDAVQQAMFAISQRQNIEQQEQQQKEPAAEPQIDKQ